MVDPSTYDRIPEAVPPLPLSEFTYEDIEKESRIGTGGDADVYRATIEQEGYTYTIAVKEPRFEGTVQKRILKKFEEEAKTWARIDDNKNIVSVYAWEAEPLPWLGLEYMDAGTLQEKIGDVSLSEALWLSGRIAEGIRYGHRHGVAHLDIKPTNVLLRDTGAGTWDYPKVSDWGLAKMLLEHSNSIEGISPTYAAPEQFDADEYGSPDDITDIYQLGAVVYALVTGEPPFSGSSTAVMQSVLQEEPDKPSEINPSVPSAVDEIILKTLAKEKEKRYETVAGFRQDLDELFEKHISDDLSVSKPSRETPQPRSTNQTVAKETNQAEDEKLVEDTSSNNNSSQTLSSDDIHDGSPESSAATRKNETGNYSSLVSRRRALALLGVSGGGIMVAATQFGDNNTQTEPSTSSTQAEPSTTSTSSENSIAPAAPDDAQIIADFEQGWNGFEVLINQWRGHGDDADATRINSESAHGDWCVNGQCSQDGQEGDVAIRKTNISASGFDNIIFWCKLIEGNTYGQPRVWVYEGSETDSENRFIYHDIRDQEEDVWQKNEFDISGVNVISIDLIIGSGAGTSQEALYDYIYMT